MEGEEIDPPTILGDRDEEDAPASTALATPIAASTTAPITFKTSLSSGVCCFCFCFSNISLSLSLSLSLSFSFSSPVEMEPSPKTDFLDPAPLAPERACPGWFGWGEGGGEGGAPNVRTCVGTAVGVRGGGWEGGGSD